MKTRETSTVSSGFSMLRQIRGIPCSVSRHLLTALITFLVHSRLDYCCCVHGQTSIIFRRLQSAMNASAHVAFSRRLTDHVPPLLRDLQWLKFLFRVDSRVCHLIYRWPNGMAPFYLTAFVQRVHEGCLQQGDRTQRKTFGAVLFLRRELACGIAYHTTF